MVIILNYPWCRHPVWPDGGSVFAELDISLYDPCQWVCHQLLALDPAVLRTPTFFRLILTFSYCLYDFLREQELGTGGSPFTDKAVSFHGQIRRAKLNVFAPYSQYVRELWAVRPHVILVKVISVCRIHVFFHQYVANLRDERSENVVLLMSALKDSKPEGENYVLQSAIRKEKSEKVLRTFATSPVIFDIASCRTSGVIAVPLESSPGAAQPLNTGVNILYDVNTGSLSIIPPDLGIKRPVMQPQNLTIDRMSESRPSLSLLSLSASFSALTLTRMPAQFSSSSSSIDHSQPLGGKISPPPGEALLPAPAVDCVISSLEDPNTVVRHEPFPGSEYPSSLPACAMVRLVLSAGPSGVPDWVGCQDLYDTARGINYLCISHSLVRPFRSDDSPIRRIRSDETSSPRYAQVLGVRRSAVFRWKPGLRIVAASYSGPGRCKISGVAPAPVSVCCSHSEYVCCSGGIAYLGVIV